MTVLCAGEPMPLVALRWSGGAHGGEVSYTDEAGSARLPPGARPHGVEIFSRTSVATAVSGRPLRPMRQPFARLPADGVVDLPPEPAFLLARDCAVAYLRVIRPFPPFDRPGRRLDPLGNETGDTAGSSSVRGGASATRGGIDVVFPDRSPAQLSYVEPAAPPFGMPRLRLRPHDAPVPGRIGSPIIAHELAHAVHFALMPVRTRAWVESRYLAWLAGKVALRRDPTHDTLRRTSPLVAWLEALGLFAERYWLFRQAVAPGLRGPALERAFVRDESSDNPSLARVQRGYQPVGQFLDPARPWSAVPVDIEGAVYAAVFLGLGRQSSLRTAVALYFASARRSTLGLPRFAADVARA